MSPEKMIKTLFAPAGANSARHFRQSETPDDVRCFFRLGSELCVRTVAKGGVVCVLAPAKQRRTAFYSGKRHPAGVGRPEVGLITEWLTAAQSTGAVEIFLTGLQMNLNGRIRRDDNVGLFSIRSHSFLSQLRQSGQSPSTMIRWRLTRYPVSSSICKSISFRREPVPAVCR